MARWFGTNHMTMGVWRCSCNQTLKFGTGTHQKVNSSEFWQIARGHATTDYLVKTFNNQPVKGGGMA